MCLSFTTNQLTDTVTTRDTECAACHESNAAGSLSSQAVKLGHGRSSRVGKPEGAKPRLKEVCGLTKYENIGFILWKSDKYL